MQFTISAATLLALVSAAMAQTAGFDAITKPAKDEAVAACASYPITWEYTSDYSGTVSIQLLEGATSTTLQLGPVIASGVDNSLGTYSWAVDCSLGDQATYGIKIIYDSDSTGATFQYSNPFQITKSSTTSSSSSSAAAATTTAAAATTPAVDDATAPESTLFSTEWVTITSCAATVTNCPARSTVVSSTVKPVLTTGTADAVTAVVTPSSTSSTAAASLTTAAPIYYPAGNSTGSGSGLGTVTLSKSTTGSASKPTSSVVTAGAGRVAAGSVALLAGAVAAVFAL